MADEKKQGDENWVDATTEHVVMSVIKGEALKARFKKHETNPNWVCTDVDGYEMTLRGWDRGLFIDSEGEGWEACQVYCKPVPQVAVEPVQTGGTVLGMDQASLVVLGIILTLWALDEIPEISDTHNDLFE